MMNKILKKHGLGLWPILGLVGATGVLIVLNIVLQTYSPENDLVSSTLEATPLLLYPFAYLSIHNLTVSQIVKNTPNSDRLRSFTSIVVMSHAGGYALASVISFIIFSPFLKGDHFIYWIITVLVGFCGFVAFCIKEGKTKSHAVCISEVNDYKENNTEKPRRKFTKGSLEESQHEMTSVLRKVNEADRSIIEETITIIQEYGSKANVSNQAYKCLPSLITILSAKEKNDTAQSTELYTRAINVWNDENTKTKKALAISELEDASAMLDSIK